MICLTFDTDHMSEPAMQEFLRLFPIPGKATFFCHRRFLALDGAVHEIAPHPFIENLSNWKPRLEALAASLPEKPYGTRTHSCVFSHMVGIELHDMGYRYISQASAMYQTGLRPFRHPWGVWELPIYYMDNMDFWMAKNWPEIGHKPFSSHVIQAALDNEDALFVFDMHPLHVALNTRGHEDYASVKKRIVIDGQSPFEVAFHGRGARAFFEELCEAMDRRGARSYRCVDALAHFGCLNC